MAFAPLVDQEAYKCKTSSTTLLDKTSADKSAENLASCRKFCPPKCFVRPKFCPPKYFVHEDLGQYLK